MRLPFPFIENSQGRPDGMWTLAVLSFIVVAVAIFYVPARSADALTLYATTTGIYFGRKYTDKSAKGSASPSVAPAPSSPSADPKGLPSSASEPAPRAKELG